MKLVGKNGLSGWIETSMGILMVVAAILMVTLPWSIPYVTDRHPGDPEGYYYRYMVVLIISGILAELILWQAKGIMRNVNAGNPFCRDTVRRLKVIGVECLVLGAFYGAAVFLVTKVFMIVVLVTFLVVGLSLLVFSELFRQAVAYKEENDMTI